MAKQEVLSVDEYRKISKKSKGESYVNPEYAVCKKIAEFLRKNYPDVLYHWDYTGLGLTKAQAGMAKEIQHRQKGFPDLQILEKRGIFIGCFLEIKKEGAVLFKKNGDYATDHIQRQYEMALILRSKGYFAEVAIGYEAAVTFIKEYLS